ncbi:MAG: hypothetical protein K2J55_00945, partial [Eubacterium sp.]|nr:hypothetical protein [Eubacterium sp.]
VLLSFPITVFAATNSYADTLRKQGFPETYISALTALHNKYPNWDFKVLKTNESFSYAVSQERKNHAQQLIEKYSVNDGKGYYCTCSSCYDKKSTKKNIDGYIVKENPNWVSASQSAVEYYMDPRNFLDERYIYQFQLLDYDKTQTQDGVEAILKGTWMYKSNITYKDKNGKTITYSPATKYSEAIMQAAEESGLSAYYLASKIVQEVGSASASNAGGSSGTYKGYEGIYNYYNLNAFTGAADGLKWASLSGYYTNTDGVRVRKGASTSTDTVVTLPIWTIVNVNEKNTTLGADGYYWYNVSLTLNGKSYTGYIRSDLVAKDYYERPWNNPYDSIVNGALYIRDSFGKTQNTGYLQKFNVNPASSNRHSHEYMANVSAATTEAYKTYTAFKGTNALSGKTTFLIPVYENMEIAAPLLKATANANGSFTLSWNAVSGATKYGVYLQNADGSYKWIKTVTGTSWTTGTAQYGKNYTYKVLAVGSTSSITSEYSNAVSVKNTKKLQTPALKGTVNANGSFTLSWNAVSGAAKYGIYYKNANGTYSWVKTVTGTSWTTGTAQYGRTYTYKVLAVGNTSSIASEYSNAVNVTNNKKLQTPTLKATVNSNGSFTLSWNAVSGATKYGIYIKNANGTYRWLKTVTGTSYKTGVAAKGKTYSYKIIAVTSKNSSASSNYSNVVSVKRK